jgi:hypothetical protein
VQQPAGRQNKPLTLEPPTRFLAEPSFLSATDYPFDLISLTGDANRDHLSNTIDFAVLAQNLGAKIRRFQSCIRATGAAASVLLYSGRKARRWGSPKHPWAFKLDRYCLSNDFGVFRHVSEEKF